MHKYLNEKFYYNQIILSQNLNWDNSNNLMKFYNNTFSIFFLFYSKFNILN